MNMRFIIFTFLFFSFQIALAQKGSPKRDYKLLWKIEGNGLKKPSYLFGTMHLYDDRVFDFSDSVLLKLKECESFAMEVHPDSIVKVVLKMLFTGSNENKFKDLLSKEEYAEVDSLVRARSGFSLEKLRTPQLARLMIDKKIGKKNKSLFLDFYLYSLAKSAGKKILGIENAADQLDALTPTTPAAIKKMLLQQTDNATTSKQSEKLISIYQQGNLDEINFFLKNSMQNDPAYYKKLITDRNYTMVASIQKEIHQSGTFIAVGAGHLPGEDGIIKLMQKAGYRVTVVKSPFTGLAKKFKVDKTENEWETYNIEKGGYSVQTPTAPITFRIDSLNMTLNTSVDISGPSFFQTAYFFMDAELKGKPASSTIEKLEARLRARQKGKVENLKRVEVSGMEALEFVQSTKGNLYRNLFVLRDPVIYMLQAGPTKEVAFSKDADRFFSSIRVEDFQPEQWKEFKDEQGAFAVQLYGTPKPNNNEVNYESFLLPIYSYYTEDNNQKETFLIRYNDLPPGYTSQNDSIYYTSFANDLKERMQGSNLRMFDANIAGFSGKEFSFDLGTTELVRGREVLRGNRFYLLLATTTRNNSPRSGINTFFSSFRFTNYQETKLTEYALGNNLKINLPSPFRYDSAVSREMLQVYYSVDLHSGIQFMIRTDAFAPYEYAENEKDFFDSHYKLEEGDSIISRSKLEGKNSFGEEVIIRSRKKNFQTRTQTWVHGNEVSELNAFVPEDSDATNVVVDYFKSVKIPGSATKWSLFTKKTDQLLADLASNDTVVNEPAKRALRTFTFSPSDLPKLYSAIRKNYPDDLDKNSSVRRSLLLKLKNVNDSTTHTYIRDTYPLLPSSSWIRSAALHVLSSLHNVAATNTFIDLLKKENGVKLNGYFALSGFADSLNLVVPILPDLFAHQSSFDFKWYIVSLTSSWLEKNAQSDAGEKIIRLLIDAAEKELVAPQLLDRKHDDYYSISSLYEELARGLAFAPTTAEVKEIQQRITQTGYPAAMLITLPYLAKHNEKINAKYVEMLASNPLYRVSFYNGLKEVNQEKLFPHAYKNQEKFAESMLIRYMENEDGSPEVMEFIATRIIEYSQSKQKLFVFKYKETKEGEWYLAVSGPFREKELTSDESLTYHTYIPFTTSTLQEDLEKVLENTQAKLVK